MNLDWKYVSDRPYDPEDFRCSYGVLTNVYKGQWRIPSRIDFLNLIENNDLLNKIPVYHGEHGVSYWTCDPAISFGKYHETMYKRYYTIDFSYYDCDKMIRLLPQVIQENSYAILCRTIN